MKKSNQKDKIVYVKAKNSTSFFAQRHYRLTVVNFEYWLNEAALGLG